MDSPTSGRVTVNGREISGFNKRQLTEYRRESIGVVFQFYNLMPNLTVLENVELPLLYAGVSAAERHERAIRSLERVGLADKCKNLPSQLSGGQQQRVSIARALAGDPAVILADEPTGALDSHTGREVLEMLKRLHDAGNTVVLITHHMNEAEEADRVVVMDDGQVAMDGSPQEVFTQVEALRSMGLTVPDTVDLLDRLRKDGLDVPLTALTVEECADAILAAVSK